MSFWAKLGLALNNLELFKQMCQRHQVEYVENQDRNFKWMGENVVATIRDTTGNRKGTGYLVESGGAIKLTWDNDARYNSLVGRLGANGGKLTRDYATEMVRQNIMGAGGLVTSQQEQPDGSIVLKAAVGGA